MSQSFNSAAEKPRRGSERRPFATKDQRRCEIRRGYCSANVLREQRPVISRPVRQGADCRMVHTSHSGTGVQRLDRLLPPQRDQVLPPFAETSFRAGLRFLPGPPGCGEICSRFGRFKSTPITTHGIPPFPALRAAQPGDYFSRGQQVATHRNCVTPPSWCFAYPTAPCRWSARTGPPRPGSEDRASG